VNDAKGFIYQNSQTQDVKRYVSKKEEVKRLPWISPFFLCRNGPKEFFSKMLCGVLKDYSRMHLSNLMALKIYINFNMDASKLKCSEKVAHLRFRVLSILIGQKIATFYDILKFHFLTTSVGVCKNRYFIKMFISYGTHRLLYRALRSMIYKKK